MVRMVALLSLLALPAQAQGLLDLKPPPNLKPLPSEPKPPPPGFKPPPAGLGGLAGLTNPKTLAFERDLHQALTQRRKDLGSGVAATNLKLTNFARAEAKLAAQGDPGTKFMAQRLKKQGLAPFGYYSQYTAGTTIKQAIAGLPHKSPILHEPDVNVGIGAFYAAAAKPFFQVLWIVAKKPDPRAGLPGLDKKQTDPIMQSALPAIQGCYNQALERDPNLRGNVIIDMVIDADGKVGQTGLSKGLGDLHFASCVVAIVRGLSFPKPYKGKPVTLHHPVSLSAAHGLKRIGRLSEGEINSAFGRIQGSIKACYDRRLRKKPKLAGTIELALTVLPNGATKNPKALVDEPGDPLLTQCILKRARTMRFAKPKHQGEVEVRYPIKLAPPK